MGIERDLLFTGDFPISVWAEAARETGSIRSAERLLYRVGAILPRTSPDTESRSS
jgi:predicted nuclease with RNAse H fold